MDSDKEVTYVYEKDAPPPPPAPVYYDLVVNYVDETGAELAASETESKLEGSAYGTSAKAITGYTFKNTTGDAVSGTMNSDKEVTYVYSKNAAEPQPEPQPEPPAPPVVVKYRVIYKYTGTVPAGAPEVPGTSRYKVNAEVSVADEPALEGYTFSGWSTDDVSVDGDEFKMPRKTVTLTGSWEKLPEEYTLTVNYVDETGAELVGSVSETYTEGDAYSTSAKDIEGYTLKETVGDAASGTVNSDKEVTYIYSKDEVPEAPETPEVPEVPEVPETPETPEEPDGSEVELPDEDVPLAGIPEEDEPLVELGEEDVPLAEVPRTGDEMILWIAAAITSALGLAWLALSEKKRQRA